MFATVVFFASLVTLAVLLNRSTKVVHAGGATPEEARKTAKTFTIVTLVALVGLIGHPTMFRVAALGAVYLVGRHYANKALVLSLSKDR